MPAFVDLRDALVLVAISAALGLTHKVLRPDFPWVAQPRQEACSLPVDPAVAVERITPATARQWLGRADVTFVDARSSADYLRGHIPGALSLPAGEAAGILGVASMPIANDALVVTYCDGAACERSEYLGLLLREHAVCERVRALDGGWNAWLAANGPVVVGPEAGTEALP